MSLAEKLNPSKYGFSPKMTAIVGAILGHDYGVRDPRGFRLTGLSITSDGFVIGHTESPDVSNFIGTARDLAKNLSILYHKIEPPLSREEIDEWTGACAVIADFRISGKADKEAIIDITVSRTGYNVVALDEHGSVIQEYSAGNSQQDSADPVLAVPQGTLRKWATQTARDMASELQKRGYRVSGV